MSIGLNWYPRRCFDPDQRRDGQTVWGGRLYGQLQLFYNRRCEGVGKKTVAPLQNACVIMCGGGVCEITTKPAKKRPMRSAQQFENCHNQRLPPYRPCETPCGSKGFSAGEDHTCD